MQSSASVAISPSKSRASSAFEWLIQRRRIVSYNSGVMVHFRRSRMVALGIVGARPALDLSLKHEGSFIFPVDDLRDSRLADHRNVTPIMRRPVEAVNRAAADRAHVSGPVTSRRKLRPKEGDLTPNTSARVAATSLMDCRMRRSTVRVTPGPNTRNGRYS